MMPNTDRLHGRIAIARLGTKECPKTEEGAKVVVPFAFQRKGEKQSQSLQGRKFATKTVSFHLCFSMEGGLEAHNVELSE